MVNFNTYVFQQSDVIVPEVMHTGLTLSQQPIGLESILRSTQHQLGAHITFCCLSRRFTAVGRLHTSKEKKKKEREKEKSEILSCTGS